MLHEECKWSNVINSFVPSFELLFGKSVRGNLNGPVQRPTGLFDVPTGPFEVPKGNFQVSQMPHRGIFEHLDAISRNKWFYENIFFPFIH